MKRLIFCLAFILNASVLHAQAWSGIIDPSRAVDWSGVGVSIPARATVCTQYSGSPTPIAAYGTVSTPASPATIQAAILACNGTNQYVPLASGTFYLNSGIDYQGVSNVTLRGQGADSTHLVFSNAAGGGGNGHAGCNGLLGTVCITGPNWYLGGSLTIANWTAGFAPGTTNITLSTAAGLTPNNNIIIIDQLDETSDTGNIFNCVITACSQNLRNDSARGGNRSQQETFLVTNCNPSPCSAQQTVVTISPKIYMPNWRSGQTPQAVWGGGIIQGDGIENVDIDNTLNGNVSGIDIVNCYQCWVKGVRSVDAGRSHVWLYQSSHCVVRDSYFYQGQNHGSQSYGVEFDPATSDSLIENNIFDQDTDSNPNTNGGGEGNVAAYNYSVETNYNNGPNGGWFQASDYDHAGGQTFRLLEGEDGTGYNGDDVHGTHHFITLFRNYFRGWQLHCPPNTSNSCNQQTDAVQIYAGARYYNVIGNVLGHSGYHNNYDSIAPNGTNGATSIYTRGWTGNSGTTSTGINNFCNTFSPNCTSSTSDWDFIGINSLMRWGNYDVISGAVRWCGNSSDPGWATTCLVNGVSTSEVPTGIPLYSNAVPSSTTLPSSFYLSGRPVWWASSIPFPVIGPDITGGNLDNATTGGHVNKIPAHVCWNSIGGVDGTETTTPFTFNANTCYYSAAACSSPSKLAFTSQPPTNVQTGVAFGAAVSIEDSSGTVCTTATDTIALSKDGAATFGAVTSASGLTKSPTNGVATWTDLVIDSAGSGGGAGSLDAAKGTGSDTLTGATSNSITATACVANKLVFTSQPMNALLGSSLGLVAVSVESSGGTVCHSDTSTITIALKGGTCTSMTLNGTATGANIFSTSALNITGGTGSCTLHATDGSLTAADSSAFTITNCQQNTAVGSYTLCNEWYQFNGAISNTTTITNVNPIQGNAVIAFASWCIESNCVTNVSPDPTAVISDNLNNPETCFTASPHSPFVTNATAGVSGSTADFQENYVWYCPSIPAGVTSLTVTVSGGGAGVSTQYLQLSASEWKAGSLATSCSPVSACMENVDNSSVAGTTTGSTTATITTSGATSFGDDLLFLAAIGSCAGGTCPVASAGAGYTGITAGPSADTSMADEAAQATAITTQSGTTTLSIAKPWFGVIVPILSAADSSCTPSKLGYSSQPSNAQIGKTLGTVKVAIQNSGGSTCTGYTDSITLSKDAAATWGTLSSTSSLTKTAVAGIATWTDLSISATGSGSIDAVDNTTSLSGSPFLSNSITISTDTTAPTAGNSGTLTVTNLTTTGLTLNWTAATDVDDAQSSLLYEVCQATTSFASTVAACEMQTIIKSFTTNIVSLNVSGLSPSTTYYFNVDVEDPAGNKTPYTVMSATTNGTSTGTSGYIILKP